MDFRHSKPKNRDKETHLHLMDDVWECPACIEWLKEVWFARLYWKLDELFGGGDDGEGGGQEAPDLHVFRGSRRQWEKLRKAARRAGVKHVRVLHGAEFGKMSHATWRKKQERALAKGRTFVTRLPVGNIDPDKVKLFVLLFGKVKGCGERATLAEAFTGYVEALKDVPPCSGKPVSASRGFLPEWPQKHPSDLVPIDNPLAPAARVPDLLRRLGEQKARGEVAEYEERPVPETATYEERVQWFYPPGTGDEEKAKARLRIYGGVLSMDDPWADGGEADLEIG
jgi:hypothetical protein